MASFSLDVDADEIAHCKAKGISVEAQGIVKILHDLLIARTRSTPQKKPKAAPRTSGPWKRK
jgi:hypothetical protein